MENESTGSLESVEPTEVENTDPTENENQDDQLEQVEPTKEEAPKRRVEKFKFKIDGQEIEEDVDLDDKEALQRDLQLSRAAKKRMLEAQEDRRKAFEIVQAFEKDPANILRRLGTKGREAAENFLLEQLEEERLSPEQKRMKELEERLNKYELSEKEQREQIEAQRMQAMEVKEAENYQKIIIESLKKSGLPQTPDAAKKMAYLLKKNLELGLDLTAEELAEEAKKEVTGYLGSLFGNADAETIIKAFGPEILKKIRAYDIEQFKKTKMGSSFSPRNRQTEQTQSQSVDKQSYLSPEEWMNQTNKRLGIN